jgi:hypothetical protein
MGRRLVLPHNGRVGRRRGLKHVRIDALAPEQAVGALLVSHDADDAPEGIAEAAPEGRALVGGQDEGFQGLEGEVEFRDRDIDGVLLTSQDKTLSDSTTVH